MSVSFSKTKRIYLTVIYYRLVEMRLILDRPTASGKDKFSFRQVWATMASPHVILNTMGFFFNGAMLYGLALFLPTIVKQLGFSTTRTQLLSVPPFAVGFVCTSSFTLDKSQLVLHQR